MDNIDIIKKYSELVDPINADNMSKMIMNPKVNTLPFKVVKNDFNVDKILYYNIYFKDK